jgi:hypothetical protein
VVDSKDTGVIETGEETVAVEPEKGSDIARNDWRGLGGKLRLLVSQDGHETGEQICSLSIAFPLFYMGHLYGPGCLEGGDQEAQIAGARREERSRQLAPYEGLGVDVMNPCQ